MGEVARRQDAGLAGRGSSSGGGDLLAIASEADRIKELGQTLIASGLLPDAVKKPETAMAIMIKGREIGMPPMFSLAEITVIQGKPAPSEQLIGTLVRRAGHKLRVVESTAEQCTVEGVRADDPSHKQRVTWTLEDAKKAGLLGKNSWKTYPRAMLRARAKSELARGMFEDALAGLAYTAEELGAEVDEEGQVVEPEAPVRAIDAEPEAERTSEQYRSEEHEDLLSQVEDAWASIPGNHRPDQDRMYSYALTGAGAARKTLRRLETIRDSLEGALEEEPDAPDDGPELVTEDQLTYLLDIVGELYGEEDERYTGQQVYERQIGQALTTLTRDEATAAIESLDREWRRREDDAG